MSLPKQYCECGREKQHFHHNCPNSVVYNEKSGCPYCDDKCIYCNGITIGSEIIE